MGKESACNTENTGDTGSVPGQGDPLEKELAIHSHILAWEIPWTEDPGGLQSIGLQRVRYDWVTEIYFHVCVCVFVPIYLPVLEEFSVNYFEDIVLSVIIYFEIKLISISECLMFPQKIFSPNWYAHI